MRRGGGRKSPSAFDRLSPPDSLSGDAGMFLLVSFWNATLRVGFLTVPTSLTFITSTALVVSGFTVTTARLPFPREAKGPYVSRRIETSGDREFADSASISTPPPGLL